MGSSFSILNDTDGEIWVKCGVAHYPLHSGYSGNISESDSKRLDNDIENFKASRLKKTLKPDERYKFGGTLSLVRWVYLMNHNGEVVMRPCWTGPSDGSEICYSAKEDFKWKINGGNKSV